MSLYTPQLDNLIFIVDTCLVVLLLIFLFYLLILVMYTATNMFIADRLFLSSQYENMGWAQNSQLGG